MFDSLLDESRFVKKKTAEAEAKGRVEGEIEALRQVVMEIVRARFPALAEQAQQEVMKLSEPKPLHLLITQMAVIADEAAARELLSV